MGEVDELLANEFGLRRVEDESQKLKDLLVEFHQWGGKAERQQLREFLLASDLRLLGLQTVSNISPEGINKFDWIEWPSACLLQLVKVQAVSEPAPISSHSYDGVILDIEEETAGGEEAAEITKVRGRSKFTFAVGQQRICVVEAACSLERKDRQFVPGEKFLLKGKRQNNRFFLQSYPDGFLIDEDQLTSLGGKVESLTKAHEAAQAVAALKNKKKGGDQAPRFIPFGKAVPPLNKRLNPPRMILAQEILKGAIIGSAPSEREKIAMPSASETAVPQSGGKNVLMESRAPPDRPRGRGGRGRRREVAGVPLESYNPSNKLINPPVFEEELVEEAIPLAASMFDFGLGASAEGRTSRHGAREGHSHRGAPRTRGRGGGRRGRGRA